ncbi:MAG: hypothetical protein II279_05710 [Bacteroidaceae bacterium]|nr:hypothetical protein [Bacteroidaceae bacterium]
MKQRVLSILLTILLCVPMQAQEPQEKEKAPLLSGIAVSADLVGLAMKAMGAKFANMEVAARLNLYDKVFPIAELGIGSSHREGAETGNIFSTTAPYMRFGLDYNFNKKHNGNRLFGILRYGFSSFNYDIENKAFTDPAYGTTTPLELNGLNATGHWLEFGVGLETKLWRFIRLGWSMRYKFRLALSHEEEIAPYYIPGFGKNNDNGWGGTVNLIFDVGKTSKKSKKQQLESNKP